MKHEIIWAIWLTIQLPSIVNGCSCIDFPTSVCYNYETTSNIYVARVINSTCNCIPGASYDINSGYSAYANTTNVSCVSAATESGQFSSVTIARTTCDVYQGYNILPCQNILGAFADCPHKGQVFMDCAPLCPTTCSNMDVPSPCPRVCVRGCGCPEGMVINEEEKKCIMPSQCPSKTCRFVGQVPATCASLCPQDCFNASNTVCGQACSNCTCPPPMIVDRITGKCVEPRQCTACPVDGQVFTECASPCPRTCDNVNETIVCNATCQGGCECPTGMVIDMETMRCVNSSQCPSNTSRSEPPITQRRRSEDGNRCEPRFVCPHNGNGTNNYSPCQYIVEVTRVFKGTVKVGDVIVDSGPDLLTSCGNPSNILSVNESYVVGIGGACSVYNDWPAYSQLSTRDLELLANNCTGSAAAITPSIIIVFLLTVLSFFSLL